MNVIEYIINNKGLRQTDLAQELGVSRAQVSRWKSGEYIPSGRKEALMRLAGLFGDDPDWAILAKTEENAQEWIKYIKSMNDDLSSCGHLVSPLLEDMADFYVPQLLLSLSEIGVSIPEKAPQKEDDEENTDAADSFESLVDEYLRHYGVLITWCRKYVFFEESDLFDIGAELESYTQEVALFYIEKKLLEETGVDSDKFEQFVARVRGDVKREIMRLCSAMKAIHTPFETDYFDLINKNPYEISEELEESEWAQYSSIDCYLPYADRVLLEETRRTNEILEKLLENVGSLLENKTTLG